ncbi:hypothetical protein Rmet_4246 (plasmid) [Cupriavidus metallidurans CH34]|uniref:Uncharacterized protein n=1 Tax=Cupriavidus metallidurans (strain ATCC 43123 / DSM 2839 / NBRC 102507 / CH34) TaxID=266264 RepID=D3DY85_CUPMC|nr:hypothetical protein Rmet_4246 [Cupriavidus metallidurans CH34]
MVSGAVAEWHPKLHCAYAGFRERPFSPDFSSFWPIHRRFALMRHLLRNSLYCKDLAARISAWREFTELT